jgi:glutaredoxin 2
VSVLLGLMVIAYSMLSTLVVNYNAWSAVDTEQKEEVAGNSEELNAYNYRIELKESELAELQADVDTLSAEADYWKDKSWKRYDELSSQLSEQRQKITSVRSELNELISGKPQAAAKAGNEKEDVFTFLSGFVKVQPKTLRLFMQAVPAMFFDIIAPFALSCAIYLAEKRKEEIND